MNSLKDLKRFSDSLVETDEKMPVLFTGHGSPMNGIEDNEFSQRWRSMGNEVPRPAAVLCISAHWFTRGTLVTAMEQPQTIHDFGGFPKALFDVQYPAPGDPLFAKAVVELVQTTSVIPDHDWGLDHGTWSVVRQMFPEAAIPVLQLSIDYTKGPLFHYELAKELAVLRKKGVLIIGSGNMVHNLGVLNWSQPESAYDWAVEMDETFKKLILERNHQPLIQYEQLGPAAKLAIPTPEHYLPLLYTLALQANDDAVSLFNAKRVMGSVSMTSVKIG